jgi:hypothetical protein
MNSHIARRFISFSGVASVFSLGILLADAQAATYPVDDSASQVLTPNLKMQWESVAPAEGIGNRVVGQLVVLVRLRLAPWRDRNARVFMSLPARPEGAISATWTTRGILQTGSLRSGERALIYAGRIAADRLEDTLALTLTMDGTRLERAERLEFRFSIEVDE